MDAYADALKVWQWSIDHVALIDDRGIGAEVIPKYSLPAKTTAHPSGLVRGEMDQDLAIQLIWVKWTFALFPGFE
jgi:hypothetical protein